MEEEKIAGRLKLESPGVVSQVQDPGKERQLCEGVSRNVSHLEELQLV